MRAELCADMMLTCESSWVFFFFVLHIPLCIYGGCVSFNSTIHPTSLVRRYAHCKWITVDAIAVEDLTYRP